MNEANPHPIYLEHWCRDRAYQIKNSTFESINREIPYRDSLYDNPSCSIVRYSKKKKNCNDGPF